MQILDLASVIGDAHKLTSRSAHPHHSLKGERASQHLTKLVSKLNGIFGSSRAESRVKVRLTRRVMREMT